MGFIHKKEVSIHVAKKGHGDLMLKYDFINKNGETDTMYVSIPEGYLLLKGKKKND